MTKSEQQQLGKTLWAIADDLRGATNVDKLSYCMCAFLFRSHLSNQCQQVVKLNALAAHKQSMSQLLVTSTEDRI